MDTLSNFLTSIRNAYLAKKAEVRVPAAKLTHALATVLAEEGYIVSVERVEEEGKRPELVLQLRYEEKIPAIERIRRISKPGRRIYVGANEIPRPRGGFGTMILSSSKGIMTAKDAKKQGVGGEVVCEIIRGA